MSLETTIVPVTEDHVVALAGQMRAADRAEVWASSRSSPMKAVCQSVLASTDTRAALVGDRLVCLFGVAPLSILSGIGSPWMLGTDEVDRHPVRFLRGSREIVACWRRVYPTLENYVDERNKVSQRWLRWLGFTLDEPVPHGPDKMLFRRFHMNGSAV